MTAVCTEIIQDFPSQLLRLHIVSIGVVALKCGTTQFLWPRWNTSLWCSEAWAVNGYKMLWDPCLSMQYCYSTASHHCEAQDCCCSSAHQKTPLTNEDFSLCTGKWQIIPHTVLQWHRWGSSAQHWAFLPTHGVIQGCEGQQGPLSCTDSLDSFRRELLFPPVPVDPCLCLGAFHTSNGACEDSLLIVMVSLLPHSAVC